MSTLEWHSPEWHTAKVASVHGDGTTPLETLLILLTAVVAHFGSSQALVLVSNGADLPWPLLLVRRLNPPALRCAHSLRRFARPDAL